VGKTWEILLDNLQKGGDADWIDKIYVQNGYKWRNVQIKEEQLTEIIDRFLTTNPLFDSKSPLLKPEDIETLKTNIEDYLKGSPELTWEELLNHLLENVGSWDNYALAITYLKMFKIIKLEWPEYEKILIDIIVAKPNERLKPEETKGKLLEVLQALPNISVENLKQLLETMNHNEIEEKLKTTQLEEVQRENP
jgi:hypothetical protein